MTLPAFASKQGESERSCFEVKIFLIDTLLNKLYIINRIQGVVINMSISIFNYQSLSTVIKNNLLSFGLAESPGEHPVDIRCSYSYS